MALSQCIKRRHLAQKFFEFHAGVKSAILAIFQTVLGWPCTVSASLKNPSQIIFALGSDEILAMLEGKIRKGPFFRVQSDELTVCYVFEICIIHPSVLIADKSVGLYTKIKTESVLYSGF